MTRFPDLLRIRTPFTPALASVLALLAAAPAVVAQPTPDPMFQGFEAVGSFALAVDGETVPGAEIYQSERARAILVISSELDTPLLVNLRSRRAETVGFMSLAKRQDGSIDVLADAPIQPLAGLNVSADGVSFGYQGKTVELTNRESLTGRQTAEALTEYDPAYARGASSYEPNPTLVAELEKEATAVRVQVFFNSKCGVCKQMVPRIIKLDRVLDGSKVEFDYYGVPDSYSGDEEMEKKDVHGVPTGIVYVGGREVGRIVGGEWRSPELAIKNVLNQKS